MKKKKYAIDFTGEVKFIYAFNQAEAEILAKAERIRDGKNYIIINIVEVK